MCALRIDRAISVALNSFLAWRNPMCTSRVPILMYHHIQGDVGSRHPYFETNTAPAVFAEHLRFLRDNGYLVLGLDELAAALTDASGRRSVVITFDDGGRSFYTDAVPLLAEYGVKATVFILARLGGKQRTCLQERELMTWREVREIAAHGITIGSHTVTHPTLYGMHARDIEYEIGASKQMIEDRLGAPIDSFSYPFAFPEHDTNFKARLQEFLQKYRYRRGVSTIIGTASAKDNRYFMPRLPMNSYDDRSLFSAKLAGNYDWLHLPQYWFKAMKHTHRAGTVHERN